MNNAFSDGVDNVLRQLRYGARSESSSFPPRWSVAQGRIGAGETIHDWFVRCVDQCLGGNIGPCTVAENIAIFAVLRWHKKTIFYLNCQALVTLDCSLDEFYCDGAKKAQYLRLDYDLDALGAMFREPSPHVHVLPDGEPRFPFSGSSNAVIDFLDFIYRNYQFEDWFIWAETVWKAEAARRKLDDAALDQVKRAFNDSNYESLKACEKELGSMKKAWRKAKDELWPYPLSMEELSILSYEPVVRRGDLLAETINGTNADC